MTSTAIPTGAHTPLAAKGGHITDEGFSLLAQNRRRTMLIAGSIASGILVAALLGIGATAAYYNDRTAPGVTYAGTSAAGWDRARLRERIRQTAASARITISTPDGKTWDAGLSDLGVTIDVDKTVDAIINAKPSDGTNWALRLNPFDTKTIPAPVYTVDRSKLETTLADRLVSEDSRAIPSSVRYDEQHNRYEAVKGRDGQTPDAANLEQAIRQAAATGGHQTINVTYKSIGMPISEQTAQQAAEQANQRLHATITITNGAKRKTTVPAGQINKFITLQSDEANGTITINYDDNAIRDWVRQTIPGQLKQDMVKANLVLNTDGSTLRTIQKGVDGMEVDDIDATADAVATAIHDGRDTTVTASMKTIKYETDSRTVDYTSPNGDPHAVVNLSEQKVYAYRGSTLVNTFLMSSGKPSTPSDNGRFFVNIKNPTMTMRGGSGADAYVTPNVKWTSFYNGGEGFHAAPWNPDGIAHGIPRSHGCINMNPADAKWIYDFLPAGSMVEVVGSTPSGAVR